MLVEYITEKDEYRSKLKKIDLSTSNRIVVTAKARKTKGKDNYILRLKTDGNDLDDAKALSEASQKIEKLMDDEKVTIKMLSNESSQFFVKTLYPYLCEYETKLRNFINVTLFDINEAAEIKVVNQLKKTNIDGKHLNFNCDFLEYSELGDIATFLFSNDELYKEVENYKKNNRFASRAEFIEFIEKSSKKTIWEEFFQDNFEDSILPKTIWDIKNFRNDVMHFHNISFERYEEGLVLIKRGIEDLDKQLKKGIVLEDTEENVSVLSENTNYSLNLYNTIYALYKIPEALQKVYSIYERINYQPLLTAISGIDFDKKLSTAYQTLSKVSSYDWTKLTMPQIPTFDWTKIIAPKIPTYDWSKFIAQTPELDDTEESEEKDKSYS